MPTEHHYHILEKYELMLPPAPSPSTCSIAQYLFKFLSPVHMPYFFSFNFRWLQLGPASVANPTRPVPQQVQHIVKHEFLFMNTAPTFPLTSTERDTGHRVENESNYFISFFFSSFTVQKGLITLKF